MVKQNKMCFSLGQAGPTNSGVTLLEAIMCATIEICEENVKILMFFVSSRGNLRVPPPRSPCASLNLSPPPSLPKVGRWKPAFVSRVGWTVDFFPRRRVPRNGKWQISRPPSGRTYSWWRKKSYFSTEREREREVKRLPFPVERKIPFLVRFKRILNYLEFLASGKEGSNDDRKIPFKKLKYSI